MADGNTVRESRADDLSAIEALYPAAFPDEDLLPLVRELLAEPSGVTSLVANNGGAVIGHCVITACGTESSAVKVALLGPLAVLPARQARGIGGALVRDGLRRMSEQKVARVFVLGDPAYYGRFGFHADQSITPPYPLPEEWRTAWQSISVSQEDARPEGRMTVPRPWRQPALWGA